MKRVSKERLHKITQAIPHIICFLLVAGVIYGVALTSRGRTITHQTYDAIRTTSSRDDVAIIGIDEQSLSDIGSWPWDRSVFARLTEKLSESSVRVAAFDVLFFEPRTGDEAFKKALVEADMVSILASKVEYGHYLSSYLATGATAILSGLANVSPDADGKVRMYAQHYHNGSACTVPLSQEAANEYLPGTTHDCGKHGYFRYPHHIATYSLTDVLQGAVGRKELSGKVVFIGSTALGLEDHFAGRNGSKVPGVYVHASMFVSTLNGVEDKEVSPFTTAILILLASLIPIAFLFGLRSLYAQLFAILGFIIVLPIAAVIAFGAGYIVPLPWLILAVIASAGYAALVRFILERKQNEEIRSMFSKYVHKDVLAELMKQGGVKLGGEKKDLTVLFSDIRGFTTLSESLSPEELTTVLNSYLSAMTPHILEERGTIDKFIGDAIMAFWNAPLPVHSHEHHGLIAALRMHDALTEFNKTHKTTLAAGIGLHAGSAVVGNVGGLDRVNYTILGDTVNLASRLEGLTKKYGVTILVTESIREKIHDEDISFRQLDVITVVGKSIPTKIYEVRWGRDFEEGVVDEYAEAYAHYTKGEWDEAERLFKKLSQKGDHPSEKMLARLPDLRKRTDWDGVWRFDEK